MVNWREHLWVKVVALTIAGVFLFSDVTWAARAEFSLSLPQIPQDYPTAPLQNSLADTLWQIYQNISSFLMPAAYAEEIMPSSFGGAGCSLPALNLSFTSEDDSDTVIVDDDTVNGEEIANNEDILQGIFNVLWPKKQSADGDIPIEVAYNLALPADGQQILTNLPALAVDPEIITYYNNKIGFISSNQEQLPDGSDSIILHNNDPPALTYNCAFQSLSQLLPDVAADILAAELAPYTKDSQTSLYGIQQVAAEHGLTLQGIELSFEQFKDLSGQAIWHLDLGNGQYHYVVATEVTDDTVTYIDNGVRTIASLKDFQAMRTGFGLMTTNKGRAGMFLSKQQMQQIWGASTGVDPKTGTLDPPLSPGGVIIGGGGGGGGTGGSSPTPPNTSTHDNPPKGSDPTSNPPKPPEPPEPPPETPPPEKESTKPTSTTQLKLLPINVFAN